jgi:hypothetical protein
MLTVKHEMNIDARNRLRTDEKREPVCPECAGEDDKEKPNGEEE